MSAESAVGDATRYVELGFEILPVRTDGSKAPAVRTWSGDVHNEFSPVNVEGNGIGIKCGALSDNLVVFDFESVPAFRKFGDKVKEANLGHLLSDAAVAASPRPGRHLYVHMDERPTGSMVCALDAAGKTLIEVRAQGAYVVAPGSPAACHKNGKPYLWIREPSEDRRYLTAGQYEALVAIAESLDQSGMHQKPQVEASPRKAVPEGRNQPGDHFNREGDVSGILQKHHFTLLSTKRDGTECWQKPGSSDSRQHQLTYNAPECPQRLYCFSSSCPPFEQGKSYDHFSVYALLEHGGDFKAAAKQLAKDGYGEQHHSKTPRSSSSDTPTQAQEAEREWMTPILFDQINTPELPTELFPSPLSEYLHAVAESVQVPQGMVSMVALAVLATCGQKRFEVHVAGDHIEPLSLWTLTALPPASRKTAVLDELRKPLIDWERAKATELAEAISDYETQKNITDQRIKDLERQASKESDKHERLALIQEIANLKKDVAKPVIAPQLWTDDTTPERLQGLMADHGERTALFSDEGGIFELMAGLYTDGKANTNVFLQGHAGSPVRVDRASRTVYLQRPALTFGLTVQPAVVADLCSGDKRRFRGNGTLARFLYCLPVSNIGSRDVRTHKKISKELFHQYDALIRDLLSVGPKPDVSTGVEIARRLAFSSSALDAFYDFADEIEKKQGAGGQYESMQDWTGKLPAAVARIAGLFHLAQYGSEAEQHTTIGADTIARAVSFGRLLIPHAQSAFESMVLDRAVDDAKCLYKWIMERKAPSFRQSEPYRLGRFSNSKSDRLVQALDVLIARNIISSQEKLPTRKPTLQYWVNPLVLNAVK